MAIDIDLEHPTLLSITVSVHHCPVCRHYFRAQPPFLRPNAIYANRVVTKAIEAVYRDGMAMRRVPDRLARDFWVIPSEAMVRQWCRHYQAGFDFVTDYQAWVVQEFSGILCVDEVYQHDLALLLAVDPAAPQGDRLIGYQLVQGSVDANTVEAFLKQLREAGVQPEQVITDGSDLYPTSLAKVWPQAAHQLCLFHETRHVTRATLEAIQAVSKNIPQPVPQPKRRWGGVLREQPPTEDPQAIAYQRWQLRRATRQAGIAQVHELARQGFSLRAIGRYLDMDRRTVKAWLQETPPEKVAPELATYWRHTPLPHRSQVKR